MLAGVVGGGMCRGEGGQRMEGGKEGVTNVTEVVVLNCDVKNMGSGCRVRVRGLRGHQDRARSRHVSEAVTYVYGMTCDVSHMTRFCMNLNMSNRYVESTKL